MTINPKISVIMSVYNGMPLGPQSRARRGTRTASSAYSQKSSAYSQKSSAYSQKSSAYSQKSSAYSQKSSAYLKQAVESILYQTYRNFEFIIVDDASTDETWRYLKSLKDKRIKLIKNQKNLGLAASLNEALKIAKGAYIARMDADDVSLPKRLEKQLKFMTKNPSIDLCGSWVRVIDDNGHVLCILKEPLTDKQIKKKNTWITALIHPTWLAKKAVFDALRGYDPAWDMVEDFDFLIRAKNFKMANVGKILLLWRRSKNRRSQKDIQKMYKRNLKLKWHYFKNGEFGPTYIPYLLRSIISTYLLPVPLKIYLNKISKLT